MKKNQFSGKRHGDMILLKITKSDLPGSKTVEKKSLTVGVGEVSGHSHLLRPIGSATILEYGADTAELTSEDKFVEKEEIFFEIRGGNAVILHEEHGPIVFTPGFYKRYNQVAYNPFEKRLKAVAD
jgi:hypothetical protein